MLDIPGGKYPHRLHSPRQRCLLGEETHAQNGEEEISSNWYNWFDLI